MAVIYHKSRYVAQQHIIWICAFLFSLILAYAFLKDIFIGSNNLQEINLNQIIVLAALVAISCISALHFRTIYKKYGSGKRGELAIENELKKLPEEYTVFHGLELPEKGGDIDFVVISSYGICVIEVKNHGSRLHLNFEKVITQASRHAVRLKKYFQKNLGQNIWVDSVLVFSNPKLQIQTGRASGVQITTLPKLLSVVQSGFVLHSNTVIPEEDIVELLKKL